MGDAMSFEDWIRTQIDAGAVVSVKLGLASDGSHASIMSWSDRVDGTWFWSVDGSSVELIEFLGNG